MRLLPGPLRRNNGDDDDKRTGNDQPDIPGALLVSRERDEAIVNGGAGQDEKSQKEAQRERVKEAALDVPVSVLGWVDERTGLGPFGRGFMFRKVPKGTNWFYTLGSATMF